jgi:hypothetical protein
MCVTSRPWRCISAVAYRIEAYAAQLAVEDNTIAETLTQLDGAPRNDRTPARRTARKRAAKEQAD